jgi:hypothetical protein
MCDNFDNLCLASVLYVDCLLMSDELMTDEVLYKWVSTISQIGINSSSDGVNSSTVHSLVRPVVKKVASTGVQIAL